MYEHLRNDFMLGMQVHVDSITLDIATSVLDRVIRNYDITEKETALTVYNPEEVPKLVRIYLQTKILEHNSKATVDFYENRLKMLFGMIQKEPEQVTTNDIRAFLLYCKEVRMVKDSTLDKIRQIIHGFFQWCVDEDYLDKNPCKNIKSIKFTQEPRHALTKKQLEKLRDYVKHDVRMTAIIEVLVSTGCRVSELCNMKLSDIDPYTKTAKIIGKGNKPHTVVFTDKAQLAIENYLKTRQDDTDYLIVNISKPTQVHKGSIEKQFREISEGIGFKIVPHHMRHTTATLLLQRGMAITKVQKVLNHSSVATTQIYAEEDLADVKSTLLKYAI